MTSLAAPDRPDCAASDADRRTADGLAALEPETINILVVAGIGSATVRGVVGAHLEQTENDGRERIANDDDAEAVPVILVMFDGARCQEPS